MPAPPDEVPPTTLAVRVEGLNPNWDRPDNPVSGDQVVWSLHRHTGSFEVFVDGRLCKSHTSERSRPTHPLTEFLIGGAYGGGPFRRFVGAIDDFRIYSRLLSAEEAAALTP